MMTTSELQIYPLKYGEMKTERWAGKRKWKNNSPSPKFHHCSWVSRKQMCRHCNHLGVGIASWSVVITWV